MKITMQGNTGKPAAALTLCIAALSLCACHSSKAHLLPASRVEGEEPPIAVTRERPEAEEKPAREEKRVIVRSGTDDEKAAKKRSNAYVVGPTGKTQVWSSAEAEEIAWLGISTEEAPEAVTAQLGLQRGEGLIITYVATNSPAATAGLKKNDLIVELDEQRLVVPEQLRKLVRMHKEGDKVKLVIYRAGKKQTITATLGKTKATFGLFEAPGNSFYAPQFRLNDLHQLEGLGDKLRFMQGNMEDMKRKIEVDVKRSVDQARKAAATAVVAGHAVAHGQGGVLADLARGGVEVDKDATVTIKSRDHTTRTMVKTDDNGSYVVVASPRKRLTAHDKDGKMVFDGEIETSEQQAKVPSEVWKVVQPMIEQMNSGKDKESELPKKTSQQPAHKFGMFDRVMADARTVVEMVCYVLDVESPFA